MDQHKQNRSILKQPLLVLLDKVPHLKLARGVVIVSEKNASEVVRSIENFGGVEFYARDVILTLEDKKALGVKEV